MPTENMFLTERDADTLILTPTVNLSELEYAESVTDGIIDLLKDKTLKNVVIDFHRTDYFGSTALGFFVRIWKTINERKGRVAFCNLSQHEGEILHITKLEEYWTIHATRAEALAAVKNDVAPTGINMTTLSHVKKNVAELRKRALAYPETTEDFPWGHSAFKVKGKGFLFTYLNEDEGFLSLSVKLPVSGNMALTFPFAKPTEYGMGKHGWVTSRFNVGDDVPIDMLLDWMDESFRAVAPKRVLAQLEGAEEMPPTKPKRKKKV